MTISDVLICDDNSSRVEDWKATVEQMLPGAQVETLTGAGLARLLNELSDAEEDAREGRTASSAARPNIVRAERADLVILDSDLSPAREDVERIDASDRDIVTRTLRNGYGDAVARQLRSYTAAPVLMVVNMFWGRHAKQRVFDLTLTQNANAIADITVTARELADKALWGFSAKEDADRFRPWQRPTVHEVVAAFERSSELHIDLDAPVLEMLGIPADRLTASQLDPFTGPPEALTLRQLADSRLGFKYTAAGDGALHEDVNVTAMAHSVLRRWLQRHVIPSQTVLLDAPHLAERYWRAFGTDGDLIGSLDEFTQKGWEADFGVFQTALQLSLLPFAVRPVFDENRARLAAAERIRSVQNPAASMDAAFAEDTSRFRPLDELRQFPSDVPGDHRYRWLEELDDVGYEPSNRLLL